MLLDSAPKKKLDKNDKQYEKPKATSGLSDNGESSSCSDDEWEDVDEFDFRNSALLPTSSIEVTIKKSKMKVKPVETVDTRRARFIKQHVNQKLRKRQMNCHKVFFPGILNKKNKTIKEGGERIEDVK